MLALLTLCLLACGRGSQPPRNNQGLSCADMLSVGGFSWSRRGCREAVLSWGSRLGAFDAKLRRGECVTIAAFGGSNSVGASLGTAFDNRYPLWLRNLACNDGERQHFEHQQIKQGVDCMARAWPGVLLAAIDTIYPNCSTRAGHELYNFAARARGITYAASQIHLWSRNASHPLWKADLVVGEFDVNDLAAMDDAPDGTGLANIAQWTELFVRTFVRRPLPIPVILLEMSWRHWTSRNGSDDRLNTPALFRVHVARAYSVPYLSLRAALLGGPTSTRTALTTRQSEALFGSRSNVHANHYGQALAGSLVATFSTQATPFQRDARPSYTHAVTAKAPMWANRTIVEAFERSNATGASFDFTSPGLRAKTVFNAVQGWSRREDVHGKFGLVPTAPNAHLSLTVSEPLTLVEIEYLRSYGTAGSVDATYELIPTNRPPLYLAKRHLPAAWRSHTSVCEIDIYTVPASVTALLRGAAAKMRVNLTLVAVGKWKLCALFLV